MKQIIIVLLLVILGLIGYGQYKEYKRFSLESYQYVASEAVDLEYHDKQVLYTYFDAIEAVDSYVITQWSANDIDVRNPKDNDEETKLAVSVYAKKRAKVKFYESILINSKTLKDKGFSVEDIKFIVEQNITEKEYKVHLKTEKFNAFMFSSLAKNKLITGSKGAFVFELQKLLVKKGYEIAVDGVYKNVTAQAIKDFEEKNLLFPDGNIDEMTLDVLLQ